MAAKTMTFTPPTVALIAVLAGAAGYAVGKTSTSAVTVKEPTITAVPEATAATTPSGELPKGHPPITGNDFAPPKESNLTWKAPASWQKVPSTSSMRLATYRVPHVAGEAEDPELSVTQVGGSLDQNIERWVGQFGAEGQKSVKRTKRAVGTLDVTIVEIEGTYLGGGMGGSSEPEKDWALLAAVVQRHASDGAETSEMPHFFKMTGPKKSVAAARADFDALVGSFSLKAP